MKTLKKLSGFLSSVAPVSLLEGKYNQIIDLKSSSTDIYNLLVQIIAILSIFVDQGDGDI